MRVLLAASGRGAEGLRGEAACLEELECSAVELVGAALGRKTDDAAREAAIFGFEHTALDVDLLHGINDWRIGAQVVPNVVFGKDVGHAVDELLIVAIARTTNVRR